MTWGRGGGGYNKGINEEARWGLEGEGEGQRLELGIAAQLQHGDQEPCTLQGDPGRSSASSRKCSLAVQLQ